MSNSGSIPAGWYHMQGDPPETRRRWDGTQWTDDVRSPQAAQPAQPAQMPAPTAPAVPVSAPVAQVAPAAIADDPWSNWERIAEGNAAGRSASNGELSEQTAAGLNGQGGSPQGPGAKPWQWMLLPYKNYANFKARSCRAEFWWFQLFVLVVPVLLFILGTALSIVLVGEVEEGSEAGAGGAIVAFAPLFLFMVGSVVPSIALQVRRLHDTGRSGWPLLGIPVLSIAASIVPVILGPDSLAIYALVLFAAGVYSLWITVTMWFIPGQAWNKYGHSHLRP